MQRPPGRVARVLGRGPVERDRLGECGVCVCGCGGAGLFFGGGGDGGAGWGGGGGEAGWEEEEVGSN